MKMTNGVSLRNIKIPSHFPGNAENDCPFFWRQQLTEWGNLSDLIKLIRNELHISGCVIIRDFNVFELDMNLKKNLFLALCSLIGNPIEHNLGKKDYIWDIKLRENASLIPTFSEHNSEAPLHTDTQYRLNPEKYISLFALKKARCGGGETTILQFEDVIRTLQKTTNGQDCLYVLKNSLFPFAVPSVFSRDENQAHWIFAPIISDKKSIRYRFDTIDQGLRYSNLSEADNTKQVWALHFFREHITSHSSVVKLSLEDGEILILDNERVLHGRTSFSDPNRHILRARMNDW
jgi:alpha-ketoglutarate-dependent taurine dioxygenase